MKFKYQARTQKGELQIGFVEAPSKEEAAAILSRHSLYILLLEEVRSKRLADRLANYFGRVKTKDLMVFTRQFATLLGSKIPLADALITLERQTRNLSLREAVREIGADVDAGLSLSQALEKQAHIFSEFYINMIRSAEITGKVDEAVGFMADYLERQMALLGRLRDALIYPAIMIVLFFVVGGILVVVVFPQIKPIFDEAGIELPFFTKLLLGAAAFLAHWWWAVLLTAAFLVVFGLDYLKTAEGKVVRDEIILRLPIFQNILKELYVTRFAESLRVLIQGGIPIAQAIEIAGHTIGSAAYGEALHQIATAVRQGESLSQAIARESRLFPPLVSQMVAVGESTGRLEELLERVAQFYTREVNSSLNNLVELVQPLLMVAIGVLVGLLFASILIPIYDLARSLRV